LSFFASCFARFRFIEGAVVADLMRWRIFLSVRLFCFLSRFRFRPLIPGFYQQGGEGGNRGSLPAPLPPPSGVQSGDGRLGSDSPMRASAETCWLRGSDHWHRHDCVWCYLRRSSISARLAEKGGRHLPRCIPNNRWGHTRPIFRQACLALARPSLTYVNSAPHPEGAVCLQNAVRPREVVRCHRRRDLLSSTLKPKLIRQIEFTWKADHLSSAKSRGPQSAQFVGS